MLPLLSRMRIVIKITFVVIIIAALIASIWVDWRWLLTAFVLAIGAVTIMESI